MEKVTYRELMAEDYVRVKQLICEAFGFFEFINDQKLLDRILDVYLQSCLIGSSYSKVAVKENQVIGIILGKADADKTRIGKKKIKVQYLINAIKLLLINKESRRTIKTFSKITNTYKEIMKGKKKNFQGSIQLFIVSKESRGLGIGKVLVSNLFDYMKSQTVHELYLYTDSRCNYKFYDSQKFIRMNEKNVYLENLKDTLQVFLYAYTLE